MHAHKPIYSRRGKASPNWIQSPLPFGIQASPWSLYRVCRQCKAELLVALILLSFCSIHCVGFWFISKFNPTFWVWSRDPDVILIFSLPVTLFLCVCSSREVGFRSLMIISGQSWQWAQKRVSQFQHNTAFTCALGWSGRYAASLHKALQYLPCLKQSADTVAALDTWML